MLLQTHLHDGSDVVENLRGHFLSNGVIWEGTFLLRILYQTIAFVVLMSASLSAATFYVAPDGNDAGPGTQRAPFASLNLSKGKIPAGSTVLVMEGTYSGPIEISVEGTAEHPITIAPAAGRIVVLDGGEMTSEDDLVLITGSHLIFEGFTVRNAKRTGISLWGTHGVTVRGNTVHGCMRSGIWAGYNELDVSHDNIIEGNIVFDTGLINKARTMVRRWPAAIELTASNNGVVQRNKVYRNYGEGISILSSTNVVVESNLSYDNFSVDIYFDNAPDSRANDNTVGTSGNEEYYRDGRPANGFTISDKEAPFSVPSKNITITHNRLIGVGGISIDAEAGSVEGIASHIIRPNSVQRGKIELDN